MRLSTEYRARPVARASAVLDGGDHVGVDLAGDIELKGPDDLFLGEPFLATPLDVILRASVRAHAGEGDMPQSGVGLAVPPRLSR